MEEPRAIDGKESAKAFLVALAKAVGAYHLTVAGGTFLTLVGSSVIGYLPYSDRPGPGWYGVRGIHAEEVNFFLSFVALLTPYCLVLGVLLFFGARFLRWFRAPLWLIGVLGGAASGFLSLYLVLGIGWYIAVAGSIALAAGVLGLLFGGFVLRRYAGKVPPWPLTWKHWSGVLVTVGMVGALIGYPLWVSRHNQDMSVQLWNVSPGAEAVRWEDTLSGLTPEEVSFLNSLQITGTVRSPSSFSQSGPEPSASVRVILGTPLKSQVELAQPRKTRVIYFYRDGTWETFPVNFPTIPRKITLQPSPGDPQSIMLSVDKNR